MIHIVVFDIATLKSSDIVTGENDMSSLRDCNDKYEVSLCNTEEILNCTDIRSDKDVKGNTY